MQTTISDCTVDFYHLGHSNVACTVRNAFVPAAAATSQYLFDRRACST